MEVEARPRHIEEGEVTKGEDVRQSQDLAVETLGTMRVADVERDLAERAELEVIR
jgi:hypothetical protein